MLHPVPGHLAAGFRVVRMLPHQHGGDDCRHEAGAPGAAQQQPGRRKYGHLDATCTHGLLRPVLMVLLDPTAGGQHCLQLEGPVWGLPVVVCPCSQLRRRQPISGETNLSVEISVPSSRMAVPRMPRYCSKNTWNMENV